MQIKIQLKVELSVKFHMGRKHLSHENKKTQQSLYETGEALQPSECTSYWWGKQVFTFVKQLCRVTPTLEIKKKKQKTKNKTSIIQQSGVWFCLLRVTSEKAPYCNLIQQYLI